MPTFVSITVHPSGLSDDYLTASDAMKQILDMVNALEGVEAGDQYSRHIVWKLTGAHTNSPPFTVELSPFARNAQVAISIEAERVIRAFGAGIRELFAGRKPSWLEEESSKALSRALKRNLNGVGLTDIRLIGEDFISINPSLAQIALHALERAEIDSRESDQRRTEYGSVEGQVIGLTRYYSSPAIVLQERLSGERVVCALTDELAQKLGPEHAWSEAWENHQSIRIGGELFYGPDGKLKRVSASYYEEIEWADISVASLRDVDVLQGHTVQEHIDAFWGEEIG